MVYAVYECMYEYDGWTDGIARVWSIGRRLVVAYVLTGNTPLEEQGCVAIASKAYCVGDISTLTSTSICEAKHPSLLPLLRTVIPVHSPTSPNHSSHPCPDSYPGPDLLPSPIILSSIRPCHTLHTYLRASQAIKSNQIPSNPVLRSHPMRPRRTSSFSYSVLPYQAIPSSIISAVHQRPMSYVA